MNKLTVIGNLVRDPETRAVGDHIVCTFTVAVNRRATAKNPNPEADFFRVNCWDKLGENAQRYLAKGRKVAVVGSVSVSSYESKDGSGTRFSLDVRAEDVEFLSPKEQSDAAEPTKKPVPDGFQEVSDDDFDSLPF